MPSLLATPCLPACLQVLEPKDGKVIYKDWDAMGSDISKLETFDDDEQPLPQNVSLAGIRSRCEKRCYGTDVLYAAVVCCCSACCAGHVPRHIRLLAVRRLQLSGSGGGGHDGGHSLYVVACLVACLVLLHTL